jgi:hypothetical protein
MSVYTATTDNKVCPDLVDHSVYGQHKSCVVNGKRFWEFEDEKGRDDFVREMLNGAFRRQRKIG